VLIPRECTADAVLALVSRLAAASTRGEGEEEEEVRVLDLCAGSGVAGLLAAYALPLAAGASSSSPSLARRRVSVAAVDISPRALLLARVNRRAALAQLAAAAASHPNHAVARAAAALEKMSFVQADVFAADAPARVAAATGGGGGVWDVILCNPPYISPRAFAETTDESVREHEPRAALVPPAAAGLDDEARGDRFYPRVLELADAFRARVVLFEVADGAQAARVAGMARKLGWGVEIWRDDPRPEVGTGTARDGVKVIGEGEERSVVCYRNEGRAWLSGGL
jgi:methylase of polypeptide subunit release factors